MKAERINQDQVRFTLSAQDLKERNLKVSELAYGSEKTKALFDDMVKTAMDQFGVDFTEKPLMIEAIPLSENVLTITVTRVSGVAELGALFDDMVKTAMDQFGVDFTEKPLMIEAIPLSENVLTITVTRVSGVAELGALFGSNLPGGGAPVREEQRKQQEKPAKPENHQANLTGLPGDGESVIYVFKDFQQLCKTAEHMPQQLNLKNALYKDEKKGAYYLIVHYKKMDRRLRYAVSVLSQYSESWAIGERLEKLIREHGRLVFKARAIQKLAEIEQVH